jgi:lysozyme
VEYSQNGLALTEQFESCRLSAYPDSKGIPTIGWGHTADVQLGDTCTQAQADAWLLQDVDWAVSVVNRIVTVLLAQNEFDALVDFCFNVGSGNFESSTMLKLLNQQNYAAAAEQFARWDKAAGVEIAGLLRRRQAEEELFELNDR